jgi:hypothetical protein
MHQRPRSEASSLGIVQLLDRGDLQVITFTYGRENTCKVPALKRSEANLRNTLRRERKLLDLYFSQAFSSRLSESANRQEAYSNAPLHLHDVCRSHT